MSQCMEMVKDDVHAYKSPKHQCPWPAKFRVVTSKVDRVVCGQHANWWRRNLGIGDGTVTPLERGR